MQKLALPKLGRKSARIALGATVAAVAIAGGWTVAGFLRTGHAPPPPDPALLARLQAAAFSHAQARPGFDALQSIAVTVARGETLEAAIKRAGVGPAEAQAAVAMLGQAMDTAHIRAGLLIQAAIARPKAPASAAADARLIGLSMRTGPASAVTLSRSFDGALRLRELDEKVHDETTVADGRIDGSLYESAQRIGATPTITAQVVKLFSHKLDFQRDIQPGDDFKLVFDRKITEAGRTVEAGDLQYAELHGTRFYRFARGHDVEYFDEFGKNIKGFLLKTPVDGAHITSLFGMRKHPILGYTRAHQGIDFGAGWGTPILAAGDGVVAQAGSWGGYGNWLRIRHTGGWDTGYGHISRFARGVRPGTHVRQGQVVAYVGATGLATGPHLHYEIWKAGQRVNPLSAKVPQGTVLAGGDLSRFKLEKARIDGMISHPKGQLLAAAYDPQPEARLQR